MFRAFLPYVLLLPALWVYGQAHAADLDDGIPIDEPIHDQLRTQKNIPYIVLKAKMQARRKGTSDSAEVGSGNIIVGPGTDLKGAVLINDSDNSGTVAIAGD